MTDLEQQLREALEDEGRAAPPPHEPRATLRRVRRRQALAIVTSVASVVALVAVGFVAVTALDDGGGTPAGTPTTTATLNGITITYPRDWALIDPDAAGLNGRLSDGSTDDLPRLVLMLAPTPPDEAFGCPGLGGDGAPTFLMSVQQQPLDVGEAAPWPADLAPMVLGPTEGGCYGGWAFSQAVFTTRGRTFDVRVGFAPDVADADREALLDAYASMTFDEVTDAPTSVSLASGFAGGEEWELIASRGSDGLELTVNSGSGGSGIAGLREDLSNIHLGTQVVGSGPESSTIVFGAVPSTAVAIELGGPQGDVDRTDALDVPDDIDPTLNAFVFVVPDGTSGEIRALDAAGDLVATGRLAGGALACEELSVSSGAGEGRAIADAEEAMSALRNVLAAARTSFTDCPDYRSLTPDVIEAIEPDYAYDDAATTRASVVSVRPVGERALVLATRAEDGTIWCLAEDLAVDTTAYGTEDATTVDGCSGGWPDRIMFGFVRAVDVGSMTISFDDATWLSGDEADEAWQAAGNTGPVPNDYFVVNDDPTPKTLPLAPEVRLALLDWNRCCDTTFDGDLTVFAQAVAEQGRIEVDGVAYEGRSQWWVTIDDGVVTRIEEQYSP